MRAVIVLLAMILWAVAAWCSRGTLGVTGGGAEAVRLGVLPPAARLGLLLGLAAVVGLTPRVRCLRLAPLFLSGLAVLPWLPGAPVPFLVWTGPMTRLVWTAVFAGLILAHEWRAVAWAQTRMATAARDPARAPWLAAGAAVVLCGAAAWFVAPSVPGGDEPHYLVITQSLLRDFDLKIENNHRERQYAAYFGGDLQPRFWRRGQDGQIYSMHMPGLPALVAPAFALGGYPGVQVFLILLAAFGAALAWTLAYRLSGDAGAAWFGWAAVTLSTTFVFHSFTVYPDSVGGIPFLVGVWALVRLGSMTRAESLPVRALVLSGAALAVLPWLHQRFALIAGILGAFILLRLVQRAAWPRALAGAAAFLAVPILSAVAWFGMFYVIYGAADPLAPYGDAGLRAESGLGSWAYVTSGLGGLFFDQQFGLLAYAPALGPALAWLFVLPRDRAHRRLALEIIVAVIPYLLSVTHFRMWWAGWSAPARFVAPILLPLAIPAAVLWKRTTSAASAATLLLMLGFTTFATASLVLVRGGRLAFNVRDGYALWLEWISRVTDLALGLPSFHRTPEAVAFGHVAVWIGGLLGAWLVLRGFERAGMRSREAFAAATPGVFAVAVMIALAIVWRSNGATGVTPTPAQLELLRAARADALAVRLNPLQRLDPSSVPARLSIETSPRYLQSRDRPLFVLPEIPAGSYALHVRTHANPSGTLWLGIGPDEFRLREYALAPAAQQRSAAFDMSFPVNVRAIVVRGDDAARASVAAMRLVPQSTVDPSRRVTQAVARRAVRYPAGVVYFFDDGAFPEPDAFWVRGRGEAVVAVDFAGGAAPAGGRQGSLLLRNAPVANRVTVETGAWREELALRPGEERTLAIPRQGDTAATLVRVAAASGFRPSEVNRASRDQRFLGVWVEVRD